MLKNIDKRIIIELIIGFVFSYLLYKQSKTNITLFETCRNLEYNNRLELVVLRDNENHSQEILMQKDIHENNQASPLGVTYILPCSQRELNLIRNEQISGNMIYKLPDNSGNIHYFISESGRATLNFARSYSNLS